MTDKTTLDADPMGDAIKRALEAATLATNAAHEAEAVLIARSDAAKAMDRTARRSAMLAALAGGASVLVLVLGGLLWLRSASDLRDAAEVQAAAAVGFAERIGELNTMLDRMDRVVINAETESQSLQTGLSGLIQQLDAGVETILTVKETDPAAAQPLTSQIESLRQDVLEAIAQTQLSISQSLAAVPAPLPAAAAPAPAPVAAADPAPAAPKPKNRPAPRKAKQSPLPNPFSYP